MRIRISRRVMLAAAGAAVCGQAPRGTMRIGQATPALSFLPVMAARALGTLSGAGLEVEWSAVPGGDPAALAALDAGDIDLAAVGAEAVLAAVRAGKPFQIIASLISKVSLDLVISNKLLERSGLDPADDPLPQRLQALNGAVIGVSALGGTQERAVRWLALQAGLDPATGVRLAVVGPPQAIEAALAAGSIDAFLLSPPAGMIAEDARTGRMLIRMGDEFPALRGVPWLVLAAKAPVAKPMLTSATLRALIAAADRVLRDPEAAASAIQKTLLPGLNIEVVRAALSALKGGVEGRLRLSREGVAALLAYAGDAAAGLDAEAGEGRFWTNQFWDQAART